MTAKSTAFFTTSEVGIKAEQMLQAMMADASYNTVDSYSPNVDLYPGNVMSFAEKHLTYLRTHPTTDPVQYIANLRLMTRKR
jgi:hypothetical protein